MENVNIKLFAADAGQGPMKPPGIFYQKSRFAATSLYKKQKTFVFPSETDKIKSTKTLFTFLVPDHKLPFTNILLKE